MNQSNKLVSFLKECEIIKSERIVAAFEAVDRKDFVPEELAGAAYVDEPLPIGFGQTISQPSTVAFMLEHLGAEEGDAVFDVGSGSGWQAALLAHIVGPAGQVYTAEIVSELCEFSRQNLKKYPELAKCIVAECGNAAVGVPTLPQQDSLDKIIAAATLDEVPAVWRAQLKVGGKMIYPSQDSLFEEIKIGEDDFKIVKYPGFVFVPFVKK